MSTLVYHVRILWPFHGGLLIRMRSFYINIGRTYIYSPLWGSKLARVDSKLLQSKCRHGFAHVNLKIGTLNRLHWNTKFLLFFITKRLLGCDLLCQWIILSNYIGTVNNFKCHNSLLISWPIINLFNSAWSVGAWWAQDNLEQYTTQLI